MKGFNLFNSVNKIGAIVILACLVMLFTACSNNPVAIDSSSSDGPRLLNRTDEGVMFAKGLSLYTEKAISAKEGGRIELYDVALDIPPGAIDNDTLFSIDIPDAEIFYNEFGTHGLVFNKPVTVTMSYRDANLNGIDESTIRIVYINRNGNFVEMDCEIDFERKIVVGQLYHFSAYGLISD
ncbi:MAG: hypothetical protein V3V99_11740 [candidate division Zixibacteria bacterium]